MESRYPAALAAVICLCLMMSMVPQGHGEMSAGLAQADEAVLKIGFLQEIDSLNPLMGLTDSSYIFYGLVYDSLQSAGNDLEATPNLATECWVVPETDPAMVSSGEPYGSVWQYNITENAQWHDGIPFTAADVAWNINLHAEYYDAMWAYQPYTYFMDYAEVHGTDAVRIHFADRDTEEPIEASFGYFLPIYMLPMHKLSEKSPFELAFNWTGVFAEDPPIVGTGPFMAGPNLLDEWISGEVINLYRNPNHHLAVDQGLETSIDRIELYFYDDPETMSMDLQGGLLDVAPLPWEQYEALEDLVEGGHLENVTLYDGPRCTGYWTHVGINMAQAGPNEARLDPSVRQAMAMATDKAYIVQEMFQGFADVGSTIVPPVDGQWHYEPTAEELFVFDLDAANATLEAAGYTYPYEGAPVRTATADSLAVQEGWVTEGTALSFEMVVRMEHPEEVEISQYLTDVWATVGIELVVDIVTEPMLATLVYSYNYDTCIWYWDSEPDPNYILFCQTKLAWSGWSDNKYYNETYEEDYFNSVRTLDPVQREQYVHECQLTHYQDVPNIVLAYTHQTYAWRTDNLVGWGDWAESPGRSLEAFWTANPLLFDLNLASENSAPEDIALELPSGDVYSGVSVEFVVSAVDADEDALSIELDYGDGASDVEVLSSGMSTDYEVSFAHVYATGGDYEITVTVDDQTGLAGHDVVYGPVTLTVAEDDEAPETTAAFEGLEGENGWYLSEVNATLDATDAETGVDLTEWSLNNGAWTEYDDPVVIAAEGVNDLSYRSTDLAENVEEVQSSEVKIDMSAPMLETDRESGFKATSSTVTIGVEYSDAVSGVDRLEVSLDGAAATDLGLLDEVTLDDLGDGEHTVTIWAFDEAGHASPAVTLEFEVETSLFALDGPAGPWIVLGMLAVIVAVIAVAAFLMLRGRKPPKPE